MKQSILLIFFLFNINLSWSQEEEIEINPYDSIEKTFTYQHGTIDLKNGAASIVIPSGFKYLDPPQAERVLYDLWGNPRSDDGTLGLIIPESQGILSDSGYVFNIQYDEMGYVKDDDAGDIDYSELLTTMQKDAEEVNKERIKEGYQPVTIVGWAEAPHYDKDKKILFWAKEIKFGTDETNTLNYNVRVLGRKGVMVLNAIATMPSLPLVQQNINSVLNIVQFKDGFKYKEFDSSADKVAAWSIGGLVARESIS